MKRDPETRCCREMRLAAGGQPTDPATAQRCRRSCGISDLSHRSLARSSARFAALPRSDGLDLAQASPRATAATVAKAFMLRCVQLAVAACAPRTPVILAVPHLRRLTPSRTIGLPSVLTWALAGDSIFWRRVIEVERAILGR